MSRIYVGFKGSNMPVAVAGSPEIFVPEKGVIVLAQRTNDELRIERGVALCRSCLTDVLAFCPLPDDFLQMTPTSATKHPGYTRAYREILRWF